MCLFPVRVDEKMKENENPSVLKTQKMWIENKNKTKKTKAKAKTFGSTNQTERKKEIQEEDYGRIYKLFRERRRNRKSDILIFLISNFSCFHLFLILYFTFLFVIAKEKTADLRGCEGERSADQPRIDTYATWG